MSIIRRFHCITLFTECFLLLLAISENDSEYENEEVWEDNNDDAETGPVIPEYSNEGSPESNRSKSLTMWVTGFLLNFKAKYYISEAAIDVLFKFLSALFTVLGAFSSLLEKVAKDFPKSIHTARKSLGLKYNFTKYVVCRSCWKLYSFDEAVQKCGSLTASKECNFVRYPNHPQESRRKPCKTVLLKSIELASGRKLLYPHKIFCYKSIKETLQELLLRPGFHEECDHWRCRSSSNKLKDIYDGEVWKKFQSLNGSPFLAAPYTYALVLNIDWFQPYTHTTSSVGVIYIAILNLPRYVRYKRKNSLLIGIIPGPSEPTHDLNSVLEPFVSELKSFWQGVPLNVRTSSGLQSKIVRTALLCVACDLPAGRKACGFMSHNASLGCSKCKKKFPGQVGNMDYSGFDKTHWLSRTNADHRKDVETTLKCLTKTARSAKESELGCRYSILLELPYFDAPTMLAVDPMHNLFLGTGKRMISIWLKLNLIDSSKFQQIQRVVDNITVPSTVGRIPQKIESSFSGFKADQFKTWITLYSIPALYDILPSNHLECWRHFVLACRLLSQHELSRRHIDLADALLTQFCKKVEQIYGKEAITPNMHMHGHLKQVILDFGPIQEYWLYSFERYNGIMGKQPTNNRAVEPQLMNRFLYDSALTTFSYPDDEFKDNFLPICQSISTCTVVGSVLDTLTNHNVFRLPPKSSRSVLSPHEIEILKKHYMCLYPDHNESMVVVNSAFLKYSSVTVNGKDYYSSGKRVNSPAVALTSWDSDLYGDPPTPLPNCLHIPVADQRPINIHYFMKVFFTIDTNLSSITMLFAYASWFYPHQDRHAYGKPVELWCRNFFESFGIHSYVPIDHLSCHCAHGTSMYHDENLLTVIPLIE